MRVCARYFWIIVNTRPCRKRTNFCQEYNIIYWPDFAAQDSYTRNTRFILTNMRTSSVRYIKRVDFVSAEYFSHSFNAFCPSNLLLIRIQRFSGLRDRYVSSCEKKMCFCKHLYWCDKCYLFFEGNSNWKGKTVGIKRRLLIFSLVQQIPEYTVKKNPIPRHTEAAYF